MVPSVRGSNVSWSGASNTRFLYIEAHNDWDEFTESWQQEVNQLMKAIQGLINPLIIDPLRER